MGHTSLNKVLAQFAVPPFYADVEHMSIRIHCTYDCLDVRSLESCETQVANLDQTRCPVDEDVVTLEVSVDDGRSPGVEEVKSAKNLPTPAANDLRLGPKPPHVTRERGEKERVRERERERGGWGGVE